MAQYCSVARDRVKTFFKIPPNVIDNSIAGIAGSPAGTVVGEVEYPLIPFILLIQ